MNGQTDSAGWKSKWGEVVRGKTRRNWKRAVENSIRDRENSVPGVSTVRRLSSHGEGLTNRSAALFPRHAPAFFVPFSRISRAHRSFSPLHPAACAQPAFPTSTSSPVISFLNFIPASAARRCPADTVFLSPLRRSPFARADNAPSLLHRIVDALRRYIPRGLCARVSSSLWLL